MSTSSRGKNMFFRTHNWENKAKYSSKWADLSRQEILFNVEHITKNSRKFIKILKVLLSISLKRLNL